MQVFNEPRPARPEIAIEEIEDVVMVYDEMLEFRQFLDKGEVMNTDVPPLDYDGAIWSGLLLEDKAVVRAFTQGTKPAKFAISPFSGAGTAELEAPPEGMTWLLKKNGKEIEAEVVKAR